MRTKCPLNFKFKKRTFIEVHAKSLCRTAPGPDLRATTVHSPASSCLRKGRRAASESNLTNFIPKNHTEPPQVFQT